MTLYKYFIYFKCLETFFSVSIIHVPNHSLSAVLTIRVHNTLNFCFTKKKKKDDSCRALSICCCEHYDINKSGVFLSGKLTKEALNSTTPVHLLISLFVVTVTPQFLVIKYRTNKLYSYSQNSTETSLYRRLK